MGARTQTYYANARKKKIKKLIKEIGPYFFEIALKLNATQIAHNSVIEHTSPVKLLNLSLSTEDPGINMKLQFDNLLRSYKIF